jgi:glucoamylase
MTGIPEQAPIGNSQMLVTIGKNGELRYLFWPTIDYPQHILGSLPGIFYSNKNASRFEWLTDYPWNQKQEYVKDTNILLTLFENNEAGLSVTATDFVLPDNDVLIRHFLFQNRGINGVFLRFFYYNDLAISESNTDDVAYYIERNDAIIHYKRNFYFLYGGTEKSTGHQCGVHGEGSDAFNDVYDSKLSADSLVLYDGTRAVNSCLSWDIGALQSFETKNLAMITAMGTSEEEVLKVLEENRRTELEVLLKRTRNFWEKWISNFKRDLGNDTLNRMARRSLLVLKLFIDRNHGGIVAAPCMDPEYRFCWPRDATFVAYALDKCGFPEETEKFYKWCKRAQEKEGGLYQRYFIEARIRGPCWSSQIDEVATVIWGMGKHFDLTGNKGFVNSMWSTIEKAANFICQSMNSNTNLIDSVGLWEEKFGSHIYSNAAVYNALKTSAKIAKVMGESDLVEKWDAASEKIRNALLHLTWDSQMNRFIKTLNPKDESLDVSLLGLSFPFEVLSAQDERIKKTVLAIEKAFNYEIGGIGRYSRDVYYGGNPWILTTLWLALYYEKLKDVKKMEYLTKWAIDHATVLDLLSEQVDKSTNAPISAIPLAWSHAFFILAILGLDELKKQVEQNKTL